MVYSYGLIDALVTPAGTMSFNDATGDSFLLVPSRCSGLAMPKVRAPKYLKGQTSGFNLPSFFLEGIELLLGGDIRIDSVSSEAAVLAKREELCAFAVACCSSILDAYGTLSFVGGSSLQVKCNLAFEPQGAWFKNFVFGLVSPSSS